MIKGTITLTSLAQFGSGALGVSVSTNVGSVRSYRDVDPVNIIFSVKSGGGGLPRTKTASYFVKHNNVLDLIAVITDNGSNSITIGYFNNCVWTEQTTTVPLTGITFNWSIAGTSVAYSKSSNVWRSPNTDTQKIKYKET